MGDSVPSIGIGRVPNSDLADAARAMADAQETGTLARKAALCVAVCFQTTKTLSGARKALADIRLEDVRAAAGELLDQLAEEGTAR